MDKYSGKAKNVEILENGNVRLIFRDSISAFDGVKKDELNQKGEINCKTSSKIFELLNNFGFSTHYISKISDTELLCKHVEIIPIEVVCRNISAGSFCKRYGFQKGIKFDKPLIEFFLKNDELHDPLVTKEIAIQLGWFSKKEAILMETITRAANKVLMSFFDIISLKLVDFKLEFGRGKDGQILIADEISADSMRLWERETGEIKDKDRYRQNLGDVIEHYSDVLYRIEQISSQPEINFNTIASVTIELKDSVLDPAGEVTLRSLTRQGYNSVHSVRLGKSAKIIFRQLPSSELTKMLEEISEKVLSNPLIEDFDIMMDFESCSHLESIKFIQ